MFKINTFWLIFLSVCALAAQEQTCVVKNVNINSKNQDFGMIQYNDSLVLFSSSRKEKSIKQPKWSTNNQPYLELYTAKLKPDGSFDSVARYSDKINTKYHDADLVYTKDRNTVYFSRSNYFNKKYVTDSIGRNLIQLYKATKSDNEDWIVQAMPFNSPNFQTGHPALSEDESQLYFVSDRLGGFGKTDIYRVEIRPDGSYGSPINAGPSVNTQGKEMFPYVWKDELYFSSDGQTSGQGGLDIFRIPIEAGAPAGDLENLGHPVNSYSDDFGIAFKNTKNKGYFSSNRPGGKGDDDIYTFEFSCRQIIKGIVYELETEVDTITTLKLYSQEHVEMDNVLEINKGNETIMDSTLVVNKDRDTIYKKEIASIVLDSAHVYLLDEKRAFLDSVISNAKGEFEFVVNCSEDYMIRAEKLHFEPNERMITTTEINNDTLNVDVSLAHSDIIETRGELMLKIKPIYFGFDKTDIRPESIKHIKRVIDIMNKYPHINVDIKAHTDSRGKASYNLELSDRRASVLRLWVIQNGVHADRITSRGYGETKLINDCSDSVDCTEEEHQKNRRIEFVITNPDEHNEMSSQELLQKKSEELDIEVNDPNEQ